MKDTRRKVTTRLDHAREREGDNVVNMVIANREGQCPLRQLRGHADGVLGISNTGHEVQPRRSPTAPAQSPLPQEPLDPLSWSVKFFPPETCCIY